MQSILDILLHIDTYLVAFVSAYGNWTYLALFAIIFCETAFVVTPFLPGDSLLFAAGSFAANSSGVLDIGTLFLLLFIASTSGNQINYFIGRIIGFKILEAKAPFLFNKKHLDKAHAFYLKHGGKTIISARFMPILRSFVPFVAGISQMKLEHFTFFSLLGGLAWVGSLLGLGYFFGSIPLVKENFTTVIYIIIIVSLTPILIATFRMKKESA